MYAEKLKLPQHLAWLKRQNRNYKINTGYEIVSWKCYLPCYKVFCTGHPLCVQVSVYKGRKYEYSL